MGNDIIFTGDLPRSTISGMLRRKEIVGLGHGVYASGTARPPEDVVRRNWLIIAGRLFPGATVTDRSAPRSGPVDGVLYLAHDRRDREVALPGLVISARRGAPPQPGDIEMPGGLHYASRARGMAENTVPSRSRGGRPPRRLARSELGDWIDRLCRYGGEKELNSIRDQVRQLAGALGVPPGAVADMDEIIGERVHTMAARRPTGSRPYDQARVRLFDQLVTALRGSPPQSLPARQENIYLPFYEAYFSNFIEGAELTVDEALRIVYDHDLPVGREGAARDLVGTYLIVNDRDEMTRLASTRQELIDLIRSRHAVVMAGRPGKRPGELKTRANQAGATQFVDPALVEGTLVEGYRRLADLDTPWERSVFTMFVVSEVHPFDDGNGRTARIMMNAELEAGGNMRTIIPTVFREDYLGALRRLSRSDDPSVLVKALRYANDFTSRIDFSDLDKARQELKAANAFEPPETGNRLVLPSRSLFNEPPPPFDPGAAPKATPGSDIFVRPYERKDGTPVSAHKRRARQRR